MSVADTPRAALPGGDDFTDHFYYLSGHWDRAESAATAARKYITPSRILLQPLPREFSIAELEARSAYENMVNTICRQ